MYNHMVTFSSHSHWLCLYKQVWSSDAGATHDPSSHNFVMKSQKWSVGKVMMTSLTDKEGQVLFTSCAYLCYIMNRNGRYSWLLTWVFFISNVGRYLINHMCNAVLLLQAQATLEMKKSSQRTTLKAPRRQNYDGVIIFHDYFKRSMDSLVGFRGHILWNVCAACAGHVFSYVNVLLYL